MSERETTRLAPHRVHIGLALSGGGFRAAAFHLGVLKRLEELQVLERIETLSTVSGGSITGALYALRCGQAGGAAGAASVDALIGELRPLLTSNLRARALFGSPWRALRTLWSFFSRRMSRVGLMVEDLDRSVFGGATLNALPSWVVINATNLRTGKAWKFYHDAAGDYLVGATNQTDRVRVAAAVAASAAYPGLTDAYGLTTDWEDLRGEALTADRWERPAMARSGTISRWRERYGKAKGPVTLPLVDGGLYDNEGLNSLRGRQVTHALISGAAPPERDDASGFGPARWLRLVEVIHDRLGAATRQLAHEMTHGIHPSDAAREATALSTELRRLGAELDVPDKMRIALGGLAERADSIARVGTPDRGPQFTAVAQMLLHRTDLAKNDFSSLGIGGLDVPEAYRGLTPALVAELSRVRTDLDALEPEVVELLIAQGYFLTDCLVKLGMPDLLAPRAGQDWYDDALKPTWAFAHQVVSSANANEAHTCARLISAQRTGGLVGRVPTQAQWWWYRSMAALAALPVVTLLVALLVALVVGVYDMITWALG